MKHLIAGIIFIIISGICSYITDNFDGFFSVWLFVMSIISGFISFVYLVEYFDKK